MEVVISCVCVSVLFVPSDETRERFLRPFCTGVHQHKLVGWAQVSVAAEVRTLSFGRLLSPSIFHQGAWLFEERLATRHACQQFLFTRLSV